MASSSSVDDLPPQPRQPPLGSPRERWRAPQSPLQPPPPPPLVAIDFQPYVELVTFLGNMLGALIAVGGILTPSEMEITSCRNTSSPFGTIENAGDNYFNQRAPALVAELLSFIGVSVQKRLPDNVAGALISNVGLGPFYAAAFGLKRLITTTASGAAFDKMEVRAAVLEASPTRRSSDSA